MIRSAILSLIAVFAVLPARAQEPASPEMLQAALQAAVAQRDQALNDGIRLSAQLTISQRDIARVRKELDEAKTHPGPTDATK